MSRRNGFTLVEILVVIFILAVLLSLTVPAVMAVRESARKAECGNRLRQLGISLAQHESQQGFFPSPMPPRCAQPSGGKVTTVGDFSGMFDLLQFLEQVPLYNSANLSAFYSGKTGNICYGSVSDVNSTTCSTVLQCFVCPSSFSGLSDVNGPSSYRFNVNSPDPLVERNITSSRGPFVPTEYLSAAAVTDGLSQTVGMSERVFGSGLTGGFQPSQDFWYVGLFSNNQPTPTADDVVHYCSVLRHTPAMHENNLGFTWAGNSFIDTWYNHVATPNAKFSDCSLSELGVIPGVMNYAAVTARSNHRHGVNVLFMDGSARSVPDSINIKVWRAMGTVSGHEAINQDF